MVYELRADTFERMVLAVELVRDRLRRVSAALDQGGIEYAVVGGNAVAAWVASIDPAAVRNTQAVDVLLRRSELEAARKVLEPHGFVYRHAAGLDMFLDGAGAKARDSVHVVFAEEKIRDEYAFPAPDVTEYARVDRSRVLGLNALVRMKLTSFRDKDRVHLRDLLGVGLIGPEWVERFASPLKERLQLILDTPDG